MTIRLVVADDHQLMRQGLCNMLAQEDDLEILREVSDGREAVLAVTECAPDLVLMDVTMPELNGIDATRKIREMSEARVIGLSDREREVLQLLAEGKSAKEIGYQLNLSSKTVDTHRRQIMQKLDLHSLPELTKYAIRQGLTPLGE